MKLKEFLAKNKKVILERWFDRIIDSYPADSSNFLRHERNRFDNPVGYTISRDIEYLYDALCGGMADDRLGTCLENIVRIRAVQDFTPSQAMAFIPVLKDVVKETLAGQTGDCSTDSELTDFNRRVDRLCLLGFDVYMKCREKIYEIKANEAKMRVYKLLERTNLLDRESINEE
ncbi:MAG: RsbRD N-terminal domain-containing protein [candidate division Zixibacteria bacterium]|nr:RsbRD N-terminal domain-containing protein [candidate division Zixibacteria bacterium]MDD5427359.1 RsbRD N-terminal domain-containing protein [candidate division Zixibacteria bacterium]